MEFLLYTTPVIEGDYILNCGFKVDMTGTIYYQDKDTRAFYNWFSRHMHKKGWTLTCGGPANPHAPVYNSKGERFDQVYSIKRHYKKEKGKEGVSGNYKKTLIKVLPVSVSASA